ncbi:MAG TPA: chorismate synthase [Candidatus Cloacimonas sp.]|nr:chorismate synthase [Candidatus Cloacimonas sp.]
MKSNSWGKFFGITTFGESHGKAMGVVLEDIKPGLVFPHQQLQSALARRKPGQNKFTSARQETDDYQILSGVFDGITTGMPICIIFPNRDARSQDYEDIKNLFRPGHADFSYFKKFKIFDYRGGGRASGRETICRVAAAEIVDYLLQNIKIQMYAVQIGKMKAAKKCIPPSNTLWWPDNNITAVENYLQQVQEKKNSVGGIVEAVIDNIPPGWGDPVFRKLDAALAEAILSLGAVKGIEFGDGFALAAQTGSQANDQMNEKGFLSNHCGGILGGISTGEQIKFRFVVKPTPSIARRQQTITKSGKSASISISGRHDVCVVPRLIPAAIAMVKLVLADAASYQKLVENKTQNLTDLRESIDKIDEDILIALTRRNHISQAIGKLKKQKEMPVKDIQREEKLLQNLQIKAKEWQLNSAAVEKIWKIILAESRKQQ